ncbi:hypothetical protein ACVWYN_000983 [Pedobacter sp. UYP24]
MINYHKLNNWVGCALFATATFIYWLTMESTVSFWDCGEFIAAAYKLQVGHQPGAPLFLMIGKLFSLLSMGNSGKIAYWMNFSSVLFSAATIMFLYWTITRFAAKVLKPKESALNGLWVITAGIIGALSFTFSDTFWFSAVEAEVYSLSILFTSVVFWAILRWEENLNDKWLVLIAFIVGLSIGVHLLSLLAIPAIVLVYYFKKTKQPNLIGVLKAVAIAGLIWITVQFIIIQYFVLLAAKFDIFFVNTLGMVFGSGATVFLLLLAGLVSYALYYSIKQKKYYLNLSVVCLSFVLLGFSSYFLIIIRANAKTTLNLSNPDNALSLYNYLGRTNYGETPLLYGQTFDAEPTKYDETGTDYRRGKDRYEEAGKLIKAEYDKNLLFPRTYSHKPQHDAFYKEWLHLSDGQTPTFFQNLKFFTSYQLGYMYWRYFFWNFVGRQSDVQGMGLSNDGNWISGIKPLDAIRFGKQDKLPPSIAANEGHNEFYGLPLILGIAGLFFLYKRSPKDLITLSALFVFTGLAIIVYLNQDPLQVRERDYAYVGSFYAFSIFIGLGLLAIKEVSAKLNAPRMSFAIAVSATIIAVPMLMAHEGWDEHNRSGKTTALEWAKNYLNSCAPNAILFTNADNDTFPLWYVQEVENYRTDVRVVNIQYLSDGNYIDQMKQKVGNSEALPIMVPSSKYIKGVRDWSPYVDYGFTDSVELSDILAVLTSDNQQDKVAMMGGSYENLLPTKKLKLTIDKDQVLNTNTVSKSDQEQITPQMEWTYKEDKVLKSDLAIFDILVHNNWKRPIYFGTSISSDSYVGLEKYLYLEGYAFRLLPLKAPSTPDKELDKELQTNSTVMYSNIMNKFDFSGFRSAKYLDPESRRIASGTYKFINNLAANLILSDKKIEAKNLLVKAVDQLPAKFYSIEDTLIRMYTVQNLYQVNETARANIITKQINTFLDQELIYIASLDPKEWNYYGRDIQLGLSILGNLDRITADRKQTDLNKSIKETLQRIHSKFV